MELAENIYCITRNFPNEEKYGMSSQMRRAAAGIPANIAEGACRLSKKEFLQFLRIARGSLSELDTFIDLDRRLNYLNLEDYEKTGNRILKLEQILGGLIRSVVSRFTLHDSRS